MDTHTCTQISEHITYLSSLLPNPRFRGVDLDRRQAILHRGPHVPKDEHPVPAGHSQGGDRRIASLCHTLYSSFTHLSSPKALYRSELHFISCMENRMISGHTSMTCTSKFWSMLAYFRC